MKERHPLQPIEMDDDDFVAITSRSHTERFLSNDWQRICLDCKKPAMKGLYRCKECHVKLSRKT